VEDMARQITMKIERIKKAIPKINCTGVFVRLGSHPLRSPDSLPHAPQTAAGFGQYARKSPW
jgi:hypothetical protein